jgi:hypothetical protein
LDCEFPTRTSNRQGNFLTNKTELCCISQKPAFTDKASRKLAIQAPPQRARFAQKGTIMRQIFNSLLAITLLATPMTASAQVTDPNQPLPTGQNTSRPVQAGATRQPTTVIQTPIELAEVSAQMQMRLRRLPGVRSIAPFPDAPNMLRLISHNDMRISLDMLVTRLNTPGVDRETEYTRFATNVGALLARTDPFKPEQLRVVIRKAAAINTFEAESAADGVPNVVVRRPFIADLEEVVVGDTPTTIALMPATRLADLGLSAEQAFDRGRTNTLTEVVGITWRPVSGLLEVRATSGYDTSLLVLDSTWATISTRLGGPIAVIVPTRDKIVIGRADRPRDIARLRAILTAEAKGERMLSDKIWVRRSATWVER